MNIVEREDIKRRNEMIKTILTIITATLLKASLYLPVVVVVVGGGVVVVQKSKTTQEQCYHFMDCND